MLFCIIGIFVVIASDSIQTYHVAIVGFLSAGLVLTTSSVNTLVYSPEGAREAAAAGHILLSMVTVSTYRTNIDHHQLTLNRSSGFSTSDLLHPQYLAPT